MKPFLILSALALLAACQMDRDRMPPLTDPEQACVPDRTLIGQPESVLAAMTFPEGTRIYRSGDALTMDYRPDRLNIEIGADGTIIAVSCG
jgi:hypothetical protein